MDEKLRQCNTQQLKYYWEFLRRDKRYREDYKKYISLCEKSKQLKSKELREALDKKLAEFGRYLLNPDLAWPEIPARILRKLPHLAFYCCLEHFILGILYGDRTPVSKTLRKMRNLKEPDIKKINQILRLRQKFSDALKPISRIAWSETPQYSFDRQYKVPVCLGREELKKIKYITVGIDIRHSRKNIIVKEVEKIVEWWKQRFKEEKTCLMKMFEKRLYEKAILPTEGKRMRLDRYDFYLSTFDCWNWLEDRNKGISYRELTKCIYRKYKWKEQPSKKSELEKAYKTAKKCIASAYNYRKEFCTP